MRPRLPDSEALRNLHIQSWDEEIANAERFFQTAETYLAWARLGAKLEAQLESLGFPQDHATPAKPTPGHDGPFGGGRAVSNAQLGINGKRPSLRRAILLLLTPDGPGRVWAKSEIMEALREAGWEPQGGKPSAQLATRLAEMIDRGEIERVRLGHYRVTAQGTAQGAPTQGGEKAVAR